MHLYSAFTLMSVCDVLTVWLQLFCKGFVGTLVYHGGERIMIWGYSSAGAGQLMNETKYTGFVLILKSLEFDFHIFQVQCVKKNEKIKMFSIFFYFLSSYQKSICHLFLSVFCSFLI